MAGQRTPSHRPQLRSSRFWMCCWFFIFILLRQARYYIIDCTKYDEKSVITDSDQFDNRQSSWIISYFVSGRDEGGERRGTRGIATGDGDGVAADVSATGTPTWKWQVPDDVAGQRTPSHRPQPRSSRFWMCCWFFIFILLRQARYYIIDCTKYDEKSVITDSDQFDNRQCSWIISYFVSGCWHACWGGAGAGCDEGVGFAGGAVETGPTVLGFVNIPQPFIWSVGRNQSQFGMGDMAAICWTCR